MRRWIVLACLAWFTLFTVGSVSARDVLRGDACTVDADEVIGQTLFATCRSLDIAGTVNGDVVAAAVTVTISGTVRGSVYIGAGKLTLTGTVEGDVHFGGGVLEMTTPALLTSQDSTVYSAALSSSIDAPVPGDIGAIGYQLIVNSAVGGNIDYAGTALRITSAVGGFVTASVGDRQTAGVSELESLIQLVDTNVSLAQPGLEVTESGWIGRTLAYSAPSPASLLGTVPQVDYNEIVADAALIANQSDLGSAVAAYVRQVLREFITLFLIGAVALVLAPRTLTAPIITIRMRPIPSLGVGLLSFILSFPVLLITLLLSLLIVLVVSLLGVEQVTALTAIILAVLNISGGAVFYFVALFISRVIVAIAIGRVASRLLWTPRGRPLEGMAHLAIGSLLLSLVIAFPYAGTVVTAIAAFMGLGGVITHLQRPNVRVAVSSGDLLRRSPPLPSAPLDESASGAGTDNLPAGFRWWE
ncbi:MAG: polymer-forming cytoskeletal protein [Pleurocapsa minor GSE-CHR-MK-17-07R]|jgi:hypothetical protein|nr:polymer-forming cytoskeletal protein [Pleurocapsa minor GSE-CHR-MK 17-07R]